MKKSNYNFLKRILSAFLILILSAALCACGSSEAKEELKDGELYVYYLGKDDDRLGREKYESLNDGGLSDRVKELITLLESDPVDATLKKTIGHDVDLLDYVVTGTQIQLDFDEKYEKMAKSKEVLFRASVTRTLCQIEGISSVYITVEGQPVLDSYGKPYTAMTMDDFIDNAGDEISAYERTNIVLYFADMDGNHLKKAKETVVYSSNISLEKEVVERLIEGPLDSQLRATLSSDRKINSVTLKDGVCYVDLTDPLVDFTGAVQEDISVYSIVNSLTELAEVNKVQISIDGNVDRTYRGTMELNRMYERDYSLVVE